MMQRTIDTDNLLTNIYLRYTEQDLQEELGFLTKKIANPKLSAEVKEEAALQLAQYFKAKAVFDDTNRFLKERKLNYTTDDMTVAEILAVFTGRSVGELQSSTGTTLALQVDKAVDVTLNYTKKGAGWLGSKLIEISQQKKK